VDSARTIFSSDEAREGSVDQRKDAAHGSIGSDPTCRVTALRSVRAARAIFVTARTFLVDPDARSSRDLGFEVLAHTKNDAARARFVDAPRRNGGDLALVVAARAKIDAARAQEVRHDGRIVRDLTFLVAARTFSVDADANVVAARACVAGSDAKAGSAPALRSPVPATRNTTPGA